MADVWINTSDCAVAADLRTRQLVGVDSVSLCAAKPPSRYEGEGLAAPHLQVLLSAKIK